MGDAFLIQNIKESKIPLGTFENPAESASDIKLENPAAENGIYWYSPNSVTPFEAFTDFNKDGGNWIVISKWGSNGKTIDNLYNANARDINLLQTANYQDFNVFARLSKEQMNALWQKSKYHVIRIHFDNQAASATSGIYYQSKITNPTAMDFWTSQYRSVDWSDGSVAGISGTTSYADFGGIRWAATRGLISTTSDWSSYSGSNSFYNASTNVLTFNGSPLVTFSGSGYGMGSWDWTSNVTVNAPNYGTLRIVRHMGYFADITSGNQWILTNNPSDSRFSQNENRRSVIFMRS
jgi:hypothetical protein